jgi:hypothetical protein
MKKKTTKKKSTPLPPRIMKMNEKPKKIGKATGGGKSGRDGMYGGAC